MNLKIAVAALCLISTGALAADDHSGHAAVCDYGGRHFSEMAAYCTSDTDIQTCQADGQFTKPANSGGLCLGARNHHSAPSTIPQSPSEGAGTCVYNNRQYNPAQTICISDVDTQSCQSDGKWTKAKDSRGSCASAGRPR